MERALKQDFCTITGESVAYIKYSAFSGTKSGLDGSNGQLTDALNIFKEKNKSKLILDLRGNGGGYMSILCQVASNFINVEDGKTALVAVAVDKNGNKENFVSKKSVYNSYGFEKIVVMCDEGTASASEALIGAMLDYDVNNIVSVVVSSSTLNGQTVYKSYGKGIMQSTFTNGITGEAVKLTTAQIYWPVYGTTIHGVGLTPKLDNRILATVGDPIDFAQTL
jgi:carboxyl-terminal processing protease